MKVISFSHPNTERGHLSILVLVRLNEHHTRHFDYSAPMRLSDKLQVLSQDAAAIDGFLLPTPKTDALSTVHATSLQRHSLAAVSMVFYFYSGLFSA